MNIVNSAYLRKSLIFLGISCAMYAASISANEWQGDFEPKPGFSEFTPPAYSSRKSTERKEWASGSSFNQDNKVRYSPRTSKNPWKAVGSSRYKKTFGSKRPWGNVPDRKPSTSNMKLHDQRFKQWIKQKDSKFFNGAVPNYGLSNPSFVNAYGMPGSMYNDPLITPPIYLNPMRNLMSYRGYPGQRYPFSGLQTRPWNW